MKQIIMRGLVLTLVVFVSVLRLNAAGSNLVVSSDQTITGGTYNNITINSGKTLTVNGNLTVDGDLIVNGALIINGDFSMGNNANLITGNASYVIIYGSATLNNKVDINLNSYFVVTGNLVKQGSDNQGSATVTNAKIYVFGTVDAYSNLTKCDGTYSGTTTDETDNCDAGGYADLLNNVSDVDLPAGVYEQIVTSNGGSTSYSVSVSASLPACESTDFISVSSVNDIPAGQIQSLVWYSQWQGGSWGVEGDDADSGGQGTGTFTLRAADWANNVALKLRVNLKNGSYVESNVIQMVVYQVLSSSSLGTISGNNQVCSGTSYNYSVNPLTGTNYSWTVPTGWTITANNGYQITVTAGAVSGDVSVSASSSCGGTYTSALSVTAGTAPVITSQPAEAQYCAGDDAVYSASVSGTGLSYQWQWSDDGGSNFYNLSDGSSYSGTNTASLTISNVQPWMDNKIIRLYITSGTCSATSNNTVIRVGQKPVFSNQPYIRTDICNSTQVLLAADVYNQTSLIWQRSDDGGATYSNLSESSVYSGTTSNLLYINNPPVSLYEKLFRLVAINGTCVTYSNPVSFDLPIISVAPVDITACQSVPVTLTASTSETLGTYTVKWQTNYGSGSFYDINDGTDYSGTTTNTLTVKNPYSLMYFRVAISFSNGCKSYSDPAAMSVSTGTLPAQPSTISGETGPCSNSTATYSVNNTAGLSYNWTVPGDWTISSGQGTSSITALTGSAGAGTISVKAQNSCGEGPAQTLNVSVGSLPTIVVPASFNSPIEVSCMPEFADYTAFTQAATNNPTIFSANGSVTVGCKAIDPTTFSYADTYTEGTCPKTVERVYKISLSDGTEISSSPQVFMITDNVKPALISGESLADISGTAASSDCTASLNVNLDFSKFEDNCSWVLNEAGWYFYPGNDFTPSNKVSGTGNITYNFPVGQTTIYWSVIDGCGNASEPATQQIYVSNPVTISALTYDGGVTDNYPGSGKLPMLTSTHVYEVDFGQSVSAYTYTWDVLNSMGTVVASLGSGAGQNSVSVVFNTTTFAANISYSIRVTKSLGACEVTTTMGIPVQPPIDIAIPAISPECWKPAAETTLVWTINLGTEAAVGLAFDYEIDFAGSPIRTGSYAMPGADVVFSQNAGEADKINLTFTISSSSVNDRDFQLVISNATASFNVSEVTTSNNSQSGKVWGQPSISF